MADVSIDRSSKLRPFLPRLTIRWISEDPDVRVRALEGTVVFVDISGFTKMSERLARLGRVGAEEVTDVVGFVFRQLLGTAYANGGGLIKFGGDALLLFFSGEHHASDGVTAAIGMRRTLSEMGAIDTSAGKVRLRMSVGVHSGEFHFFLVGERHRELLLTGPGASAVVAMEGTADAGEVVVSLDTAAQLPAELLSQPKGDGIRLRRHLRPDEAKSYEPDPQHVPRSVDLAECIPVSLRELLLTGHGDPEHRRVTIGFIHYDGLDEMVAARPAEEVADALEALVSAAQVACEAHGVTFLGTDVDRDGGKLILVAGAPTASGDDEARMLAALREVQAAELRIPIRVGVNTGPVFAGDIGPSYRRTYTVMGDAVNLAARVMGKAEPGQILAAQSVLDACSVTFETTELDPFMVKGKTLPVYASVIGRPLGAKSTADERELPMVGRDFETGDPAARRPRRAARRGLDRRDRRPARHRKDADAGRDAAGGRRDAAAVGKLRPVRRIDSLRGDAPVAAAGPRAGSGRIARGDRVEADARRVEHCPRAVSLAAAARRPARPGHAHEPGGGSARPGVPPDEAERGGDEATEQHPRWRDADRHRGRTLDGRGVR